MTDQEVDEALDLVTLKDASYLTEVTRERAKERLDELLSKLKGKVTVS